MDFAKQYHNIYTEVEVTMNISRAELKQRSVGLIRSSKPSVILVALAYTALSFLMYLLSARLTSYTTEDMTRYMQYVAEGNIDYALACLEDMVPTGPSMLIDSLLRLMLSVVNAGFIIFLLNTIRNAGACFGNLLDGFGFFFKLLLLYILEGFFVLMWSLLLVIPGIIAAYRYSMAIYLLVDNPELSPLECIRRSKAMMKGHKWELFVLELSFLGWNILAMLPVIGYAVQIWTVPYISMTMALYYEKLSGRDIYAAQKGNDPGSVPPPWEF